MSNMKIVVTGGSGRLGQHVIRELQNHRHEVLSLDRVVPQTKLCPSWIADLTRAGDIYQAVRGADGMIHLAGYQAPDLAPDSETFGNNVTATYNVLHAAAALRVRKVVIASSTAAFGFLYARRPWLPEYLPLDEKHPCKPQDPYGLSKLVGEKIAGSFAEVDEISICSLRFPGINFDPSYQGFAERWQDPSIKLGRFWSYIDARDAACACRLALEAAVRGHDFFGCRADEHDETTDRRAHARLSSRGEESQAGPQWKLERRQFHPGAGASGIRGQTRMGKLPTMKLAGPLRLFSPQKYPPEGGGAIERHSP